MVCAWVAEDKKVIGKISETTTAMASLDLGIIDILYPGFLPKQSAKN
jgi:hypothetical protein